MAETRATYQNNYADQWNDWVDWFRRKWLTIGPHVLQIRCLLQPLLAVIKGVENEVGFILITIEF